MTRKLKVDLFTDVVCPWCLIGSVRLDKAIAALPEDVEVEVENHPFYLDPSVPAEGVDVGHMLKTKYGRDPQEMWARPQAEAKKSGVDLDLSRQPRMFRTAKAHTITRLAKSRDTQHAWPMPSPRPISSITGRSTMTKCSPTLPPGTVSTATRRCA